MQLVTSFVQTPSLLLWVQVSCWCSVAAFVLKSFYHLQNEWRISIILINDNLISCHALITLWLHCLVWGSGNKTTGLVDSGAALSDPAAPAIAFQLPGFPSALEQDHVLTLELAWAGRKTVLGAAPLVLQFKCVLSWECSSKFCQEGGLWFWANSPWTIMHFLLSVHDEFFWPLISRRKPQNNVYFQKILTGFQ